MSDPRVSVVNEEEKLLLQNLPTDVLLIIFWYCDDFSLGRLSQQCRRFNEIISDDFLWIERSRKALVTNQLSKNVLERSFCILSLREKCRISNNWKKGKYKETVHLSQKTRYIPWLTINSNYLWASKGSSILSYERKYDGIYWLDGPVHRLLGHRDDVCRFVETENFIISGGRDGSLCGWSTDHGGLVLCERDCHTSDINAVSVIKDILISGSRDKTLKFWRWQVPYFDPLCTINVRDRIWCTSACPKGNLCAVGSSGLNQIPPLHLYDLERGEEVMSLNGSFVAGAGVLDTIWETPHLLLSTGYDSYIRLWDTRSGANVSSWEDPYDTAIYCLASDNLFTIICGTAQHGRVQLWDKRQRRSMQMYFMSANRTSSVYSIAFDPCHLFVALDQSVNLMDFSGAKNNAKDMTHHLNRCN